MAEEVERRALRAKERPRVARYVRDRRARRDAVAVTQPHVERGFRVEDPERFERGVEAGEHAGLPRDERRTRTQTGGYGRLGRHVAAESEILHERRAHERLEERARQR